MTEKGKEKRFSFGDLVILLVFLVVILAIHYIIKIVLKQQAETNSFYVFLPYLIDTVLIIIGWFYVKYGKEKKTKDKIKVAMWIPFLDIAVNFIIFLVGLLFNLTNDFTLMFKSSNGIFAVALVIIADYFWWKAINFREKN
ncbi:MAG: hypothetical protein WC796_04570 [Candidatus Pacearchaeota archaeon]|jgi:hypothetical protein